ncbi:lipoprotein, putative, partial [Listeria ivanovii FSL F6-596]
DSSAASVGILKDIKFSMTTSTDTKANKSESKLNVTSTNNLLPISIDLDFLVNTKTASAFIPLKSIVEPDESLLSYLDQATNGMWSKLNTEYPDLKNKYLSTEELTSTLTGETVPETAVDTKKVEAASKDLSKKGSKLLNTYLTGLEKDRFKEADDGTISVTLTKTDIANLVAEAAKMMDDEKVKADFKVIIESQGTESLTDFETTYADTKSSLEDVAKDLKANKDRTINFKVSVKPGKDDALDAMTLNVKMTDKSNAEAPESIAFKVKVKAEKFVPISDFPTKDEIISSDELSAIVTDFYTQMYSGMDLSGSGL